MVRVKISALTAIAEQIEHLVSEVIAEAGDLPLTLSALSNSTGVPPFKLHRAIKAETGMTPAKLVESIKLRRAATDLLLLDVPIALVAQRAGFNNHETFSRAFRRLVGSSPRQFRKEGSIPAPGKRVLSTKCDQPFWIGTSEAVSFSRNWLISKRHVGPYTEVPFDYFDEVMGYVSQSHLSPTAYAGIGLDNPQITPPGELRFDAAVVVAGDINPETITQKGFRASRLPAGTWIRTRFVGPYTRMSEAIANIAHQSRKIADIKPGPLIEMYHAHSMTASRIIEYTDVYLYAGETID